VQSVWGRGLFKKPETPVAPAIRVAAADAKGIVDTGATNHVSGCSHLLSNLRRLKQDILLNLASFDGSVMATHVGSLRLRLKHSMIKLDNVLYCPSVRGTLISLGQLLDDDFTIAFENQSMLLTAPVSGDQVVASFSGRSWLVPILPENCNSPLVFSSVSSPQPETSAVMRLSGDWQSLLQLHNRLGHASDKVIKSYLRCFVPSFDI
ncbi:uncharacterized protein VP01_8487g1, partial [Puccinia sorghi]